MNLLHFSVGFHCRYAANFVPESLNRTLSQQFTQNTQMSETTLACWLHHSFLPLRIQATSNTALVFLQKCSLHPWSSSWFQDVQAPPPAAPTTTIFFFWLTCFNSTHVHGPTYCKGVTLDLDCSTCITAHYNTALSASLDSPTLLSQTKSNQIKFINGARSKHCRSKQT